MLMKLLEKYMRDHQLNQTQFADKVGVNQGLVSMWLNQKVQMAPKWALKVERVTEGELSRYDLRPDIYPRDAA
jgi:DNA-binding transcriptional regulator YdaS (Cro superfamily)